MDGCLGGFHVALIKAPAPKNSVSSLTKRITSVNPIWLQKGFLPKNRWQVIAIDQNLWQHKVKDTRCNGIYTDPLKLWSVSGSTTPKLHPMLTFLNPMN